MSSTSLRRKVVVLLLLISVLTAPGAFAGHRLEKPRPAHHAEPAPLALVSRAWSFLTSLWSKTGCQIDPSGRCASSTAPLPPPTGPSDIGCNIDPNGRCGS
ncbi:MAG TPA: hypothetical protein VNM67_06955 [Thermoanaerobaculia bacterium]|nr:hypothetical protein [Thermoanaerobaculia bacterium]